MGSPAEIGVFVANYSPASIDRIRFAWNGKHAAELVDANQAFRGDVVAFVVDQPHKAPLILLRDLFLEEAGWCREAWCASQHFSSLAETVIKKCGVPFLDDFLKGMMASFDTFGACHQMRLGEYEIDEFSKAIKARLAEGPEKSVRSLLESGRDLFRKYREGTAARGWVTIPPGTPVSRVSVVQPTLRQRIRKWFVGRKK
jgi:hypothetical protein